MIQAFPGKTKQAWLPFSVSIALFTATKASLLMEKRIVSPWDNQELQFMVGHSSCLLHGVSVLPSDSNYMV